MTLPDDATPFIHDGRLDVIAWLGSRSTADQLAETRAALDTLKERLSQEEDHAHKQELAKQFIDALHTIRMLIPFVPLGETAAPFVPVILDAADGIIRAVAGE